MCLGCFEDLGKKLFVLLHVYVPINSLLPFLCCTVTWDSLNMVRNRFLSSSSGAWSISSGVKRVLSWGGGGVRLDCDAGGEGLRSLSILLLFRLFCCTSSSRRPAVVRPNTPRKSTFCSERQKEKTSPSCNVSSRVLVCASIMEAQETCVSAGVLYLAGVIQFEWGLLCHSPEMGFHLLFITLIIRVIQLIVISCSRHRHIY